jgi:hypothetical protein
MIYGGSVNDPTPEIMLNCFLSSLPGTNIGFFDNKAHTIGKVQSFAVSKTYSDLSLTFYESQSGKERKYFDEWHSKIYNEDTKRFSFYSEYVKDIVFEQYDPTGRNLVFKYVLENAFPVNVSPLERTSTHESPSQFNVTLRFENKKEIYRK